MTHVITNLCLRDAGCVAVCPVACIVPGKPQNEYPLFYIDPSACIDCGACIPECPYGAIFPLHEIPTQFQAVGGEVLSAPVGTPSFDKPLDVFTYEGEPVHLQSTKTLNKGDIVDFTSCIADNNNFFVNGPGYLAVEI